MTIAVALFEDKDDVAAAPASALAAAMGLGAPVATSWTVQVDAKLRQALRKPLHSGVADDIVLDTYFKDGYAIEPAHDAAGTAIAHIAHRTSPILALEAARSSDAYLRCHTSRHEPGALLHNCERHSG